jgi:hypothetical protein
MYETNSNEQKEIRLMRMNVNQYDLDNECHDESQRRNIVLLVTLITNKIEIVVVYFFHVANQAAMLKQLKFYRYVHMDLYSYP